MNDRMSADQETVVLDDAEMESNADSAVIAYLVNATCHNVNNFRSDAGEADVISYVPNPWNKTKHFHPVKMR